MESADKVPFVLAPECCRQVHKTVKKKRAFCLEEIAWVKTASSFSWVRAHWRAQPLPPVLSVLHSLIWRACPIFYFCGLHYQLNGPDFSNYISNFDPLGSISLSKRHRYLNITLLHQTSDKEKQSSSLSLTDSFQLFLWAWDLIVSYDCLLFSSTLHLPCYISCCPSIFPFLQWSLYL